MTRPILYVSILVCTGVLTFSLAASGRIPYAVVIALLGAAWLVLHVRGKIRFAWIAFVLFSLISLLLTWFGTSHWFVLTGLLMSLLAWDLTIFEAKLHNIPVEDVRKMETAHFTRLALVIGLGLAGILAAGFIQVNLTFGVAIILVLLGIWGVSTLVYRLRGRE